MVAQTPRRMTFRTRLVLVFVLLIALTAGLSYFLANLFVDRAFEDFAVRNVRVEDLIILRGIAQYYREHGSMDGLPEALEQTGRELPVLLLDPERRIVFASDPDLVGRRLGPSQLESGVTLRVEGEEIWTVLPGALSPWRGEVESRFLDSVNRGLIIAGAAVGLIGIVLGFVVWRQVTGPLRRLAAAAGRIAQGHLDERVLVTSRDELGTLAQSFNDMAESLEQSEAAKRQMIADISHELRTPITALRSGLEAMRDGLVEASQESFAGLHSKTLLTARLVEDLQQLALADAGRLSVRAARCDVRELLGMVEATVGVQLEDAGVRFELRVEEGVTDIDADRQRIEQVILNLLANAARYTPEGGSVWLSAEPIDGRAVRFSVCDTGPGLTTSDLHHAFDRFYRADKARAEGGGAGLGLAIAKALVEAHGGRIWAENRPQGGACFRFELPKTL
ncbi:MAG: HAMP domain-containing protein [Candidatus Bipolaricaulota bacterium]|nr:MAG: HAMP domain-containing protein [Candidatus Bipolaricaulota bacterium]